MTDQYSLLFDRRFLPYFTAQFLGAFNDNLWKSFVVVMIAYGLWDTGDMNPAILVSAAAGLFILPFVLFCPLAGALCDKYPKDKVIRIIKAAEIGIVMLGASALFSGNLVFALAVLFLLGLQSAFFSPVKFAALPALLKKDELIAGNAWVTSGTYIAILAGTILGAYFAALDDGKLYTAFVLMLCSIAGYIASRYILSLKASSPRERISLNVLSHSIHVLRHALEQKRSVLIAIIGVSWFYFVAATFHAQFPNFTKITLGADNIVLLCFMVVFSVGIGLGGMLNNRILKSKIDTKYVPLAALFIVALGADIYQVSTAFPKPDGEILLTFSAFMKLPEGVHLMIAMLLQSMACGFYVVPLRALVQDRVRNAVKARVISASNLLDALFVLASSIFAVLLLSKGVAIEELYGLASSLTFVMAVIIYRTRHLA